MELLDCSRQHQVQYISQNSIIVSFPLEIFYAAFLWGCNRQLVKRGFPFFLFAAFGVGSHASEELAALGGPDSTSFSSFWLPRRDLEKKGGDKWTTAAATI